MPTQFPTSPDSFTPKVDGTDYPAASHINELQESVVAAQNKIGADGSVDNTSHDFKLSLVTGAAKAIPNDGGTLTGEINLGENAGMVLDPSLSADGKYSGISISGTAGETLVFGDLCYLVISTNKWLKLDANLNGVAFAGMCVQAAAADGSATKMLTYGVIRADARFPDLSSAWQVYMSETAGSITGTQPTTSNVFIRVMGNAISADAIFFNPSQDYIVHV